MSAQSDCPFGPNLAPYWESRYALFQKWDKGIQIDEVGLYSVKPEKAALQIAERFRSDTVLDAFCGVGGSAIAFARLGKRVITVDNDKVRLDMARHNARIYGVENQIEFVLGDTLSLLDSTDMEAVYFDPPWGGVEYIDKNTFKLSNFSPDGHMLLNSAFKHFHEVGFTLPINFDWNELRSLHRDVLFFWSHTEGFSNLREGDYLFVTALMDVP